MKANEVIAGYIAIATGHTAEEVAEDTETLVTEIDRVSDISPEQKSL